MSQFSPNMLLGSNKLDVIDEESEKLRNSHSSFIQSNEEIKEPNLSRNRVNSLEKFGKILGKKQKIVKS